MQNKFFSTDKLSDSVTRIHGMGGELCYLIEGNERALLIDGLTGVGSLKAFVRELTELPVMMAATHGHIDHVGAAWEYGEVFINPDDIALMYTPHHSEPAGRLGFASAPSFTGEPKRTVPTLADVPAPRPVKTYPFYEGDIFDLGGIQIEVIQVPGHTQGTVVFRPHLTGNGKPERIRVAQYKIRPVKRNLLPAWGHARTAEVVRKKEKVAGSELIGGKPFLKGHFSAQHINQPVASAFVAGIGPSLAADKVPCREAVKGKATFFGFDSHSLPPSFPHFRYIQYIKIPTKKQGVFRNICQKQGL